MKTLDAGKQQQERGQKYLRPLFRASFMLALLISCFLTFHAALAQDDGAEENQTANSRSLILSDAYSEHYLSPYLMRYQDENNDLNVEQIISSQQLKKDITSESGSITALSPAMNATWLSFDIMNRSSNTDWKIDFGSSFMGRFGLFDKIESYTANKNSGEVKENNFSDDGTISLTIPTDEKTQVILKLKSAEGLPATLPLRLLRQSVDPALRGNTAIGIATILLIGMAFFFAAVAVIRSTPNYLYFTLYYGLLTALLMFQNNMVEAAIPLIGSRIIPLIFLSIAICSLMIARLFWNMEDASRFAKLAFTSFIGMSICSFVGAMILPVHDAAFEAILQFGPSILIISMIPMISIVQSQQGNNEATPFLFGWFILLFGAFISLLSLSGIMPAVSTAINAYWFTLIPQAGFFIIATKMKLNLEMADATLSRTLEINETGSVSRLRQSRENTEQERLLRVIEQERKVLGELRKSEARRTEEMRTAKDEADVANKAKSAFLAVVSHEIRTPMTGVMGMVKLLLDSNLTKEQKEFAQTIQDSSDAMLALLNDILDFEKIEQGKMAFESISFDLHRMIQGVATLMNGHATQKGIELKTNMGDNLPRYVKGDPTRLRQVLLNMTGNAVKFTTEGHVTLTAQMMSDPEGSDEYEIYFGITDSGIGIPKNAQKDLFSPFSQADSSIARKFGGTGLGLAISKGLIEAMGSQININSNEGEGSTFFFTLKMPAGTSSDAQRTKRTDTSDIKAKPMAILVVDDNAVNQKVIRSFLERYPYKLDMASTAKEGLNKLEEKPYDLILMDIELPGMRGDEATREIRKSNNRRIKNTPILALTGNIMPQHISEYYDAGMNGIIAKPIDAAALSTAIINAGQGIFDQSDRPSFKTNRTVDKEIKLNPNAPEKKKPSFQGGELVITQTAMSQEPAAESEPKNKPIVFNPDMLKTLKGHISDKDIQDMVNDVFDKTSEITGAMENALSTGNAKELSAKGHELRGMTGNFGFMEISNQAHQIEIKADKEASIILTGLVSAIPAMQKRAKEALDHWITSAE